MKRNKKNVLLILFLVFILIGCQAPKHEEVLGYYEEGVYYNEYYQFKYNFENESDFKDAKALAAGNNSQEEMIKLLEKRGQDLSMIVYSVVVEDGYTIEQEKENLIEFYTSSGFVIEDNELTREIADKTFTNINLKIVNSSHDNDFYIYIKENQMLTIHISYLKDLKPKAQELIEQYEAI